MFGKGLSSAALAQIRAMIREEARAEIERYLNPTFLELMTSGRRDMEHIFDAVLGFESELTDVKLSLKILQKMVDPSAE